MDERFSQQKFRLYRAGDWVFRKGDTSAEMFVVSEGEVEILQGEKQLAIVKRGDFLGEMAILESSPRSACARALQDTKLLVIPAGGFLLKIRRDPSFAFELLQCLSKRIRKTNEILAEFSAKGGCSQAELDALLKEGSS